MLFSGVQVLTLPVSVYCLTDLESVSSMYLQKTLCKILGLTYIILTEKTMLPEFLFDKMRSFLWMRRLNLLLYFTLFVFSRH